MIVTVTLNPALDVDTATEQLVPGEKLRCSDPISDPGGGGVNVARVVARLGGEVLAICTTGGAIGGMHRRLLEAEGVPTRFVPIAGETRQSLSVDELATGEQYRFILPGPRLDDDEWAACVDAVAEAVGPGDVLVLSGSLPPGVPDDAYARLAAVARERGARTVVDASGAALEAAIAGGVDLVKPSRPELEALVGRPLPDPVAQEAAARELVAAGTVGTVALTLGSAGAMLVTADRVIRGAAIDVERHTTVGAGDSFLAALLVRMDADDDPETALRWALAAAASAISSRGTGLVIREQVEQLAAV